ncbi:MAG: LysM peptidoglycan-binding domain-containing protein [Cytophagales bacterium]|nr:LysM peptidoglycan-binding domain-containing protein [Cytophagales bacterium]
MLLVLLFAGSLVAYPQINFPQNLQKSTAFWEEVISFPNAEHQETLAFEWSGLSNHKLSKFDFASLEKVLALSKHHISELTKEKKQFLFKYQHLAIYLSGMNPNAVSDNDRSGIWMLTYPDATRYGLIVNDLIDERRDIAKSTEAARLLFKDLKGRHGSNTEAMFVLGTAGWKRSEEVIIDAIEEDLTALRLISKTIQSEGSLTANSQWKQQVFDGEVSIDVLSRELGLDDIHFHHMNPSLVGRNIPSGAKILVPNVVDVPKLVAESKTLSALHKTKQDSIVNRIKQNIPSPETHKVITYRVKSGDVLGKIAENYGVRVSKVKKWNNLRSDRIDINQKLTIYYPKGKKMPKKAVAKKMIRPEVILLAEGIDKFTIYEVQQGDTLWAISKKFTGVKPEDIMAWNEIGATLSIGQKLKIKTLN